MKLLSVLLIVMLMAACNQSTNEVKPLPSHITVYIYWNNQGLAGKQVAILQTADTLLTDSAGLATFTVPPGHYTIRAFNIDKPGTGLQYIDYEVDTHAGDTTKIDILDCLACV